MTVVIGAGMVKGNTLSVVADDSTTAGSFFFKHSASTQPNGYVARIDVDGSYNIIGGTSGPIVGTTGSFSSSVGVGGTLTVNGSGYFISPGSGTTGALIIKDASGNPNAAYLQFVNNADSAQYGYIRGLSGGGLDLNGNITINSAGVIAGSSTYGPTSATVNGNITSGDIHTNRGNNTGVIYLGNSGSQYLYFDGSTYQMPNGALVVGNGGITAGGTITGTNFTVSGTSGTYGPIFDCTTGGTGYTYAQLGNTANNLLWGVGTNSGNGGLVLGGSPNYAVIGSTLNYGFHIATNNTVRFTIDNAGNTTYTGLIQTYSGSASSYGATTIRGQTNTWGGLHFQDTAGNNLGTLMFQTGAGGGQMGFYNAANTNWPFQVSQAGVTTCLSTCTATAFYVASSRALKKNIIPLRFDALKAIAQTEIVHYQYKDGPDQDEKLGFIAEDTPTELVGIEPRFDTNRVLSVALAAIKQLEARLALLENK